MCSVPEVTTSSPNIISSLKLSFFRSRRTHEFPRSFRQVGNCMFMDVESFEEVMVEQKMIEEQKKWISEGMECVLIYFKGEVIEVRAPTPYVFEVVETEPNVKGNTSQGYTKPAVLSCGATITVPGFVEQGQMVKVDTEKGEYMERV